jgi:hypothetical protein
LVIHELGHVFSLRRNNQPYTDIDGASVTDSRDSHVFGTPAGSTIYERTVAGYLSDRSPYMYHGPAKFDDFYVNAHDDFADMFLNWTRNSFDYSFDAFGAGIERYNWMSQNMYGWLSIH